MADWRVAGGLQQLLAQLDAIAPERSRASDGAIGDVAHQKAGTSDHLPWWSLAGQHYVTARDFTHDPDGGLDCNRLAAALVNSRDQRIKYIIWNKRIVAGNGGPSPWTWRPYSGANPHTKHLHLSVVADLRSLAYIPWALPGLLAAGARTPLLRRGSRGLEVERLQRVLAAWYPALKLQVDGAFGPATEDAVRQLQANARLAVDGVVGPRTRAVLHL